MLQGRASRAWHANSLKFGVCLKALGSEVPNKHKILTLLISSQNLLFVEPARTLYWKSCMPLSPCTNSIHSPNVTAIMSNPVHWSGSNFTSPDSDSINFPPFPSPKGSLDFRCRLKRRFSSTVVSLGRADSDPAQPHDAPFLIHHHSAPCCRSPCPESPQAFEKGGPTTVPCKRGFGVRREARK